MDDAGRCKAVGQYLGDARRSLRISKREAARRANVSEITWRQLEAGQKQIDRGLYLPYHPSDDTLEAASLAVGLDPSDVFALAERPYQPRAPRRPSESVQDEEIAALRLRQDALEAQIAQIAEALNVRGPARRKQGRTGQR